MTLLLICSFANAADIEVSAEVTRIDVVQGNWDVFDWDQTKLATGIRAEWHKSTNLAFAASYAQFVTGGHNTTWDTWDYEGVGSDSPGATEGFDAAFRGHLVGVGVRGGVDLWAWLNPYVMAEARGLHAAVRLDDDTSKDDNINQITMRGTTVGAAVAAGLDIRMPTQWGWSVSHHLEVGYEIMAPLNFGTMGSLSVRGLHVRAGLGVRF
jgi:hypothetical protein